MKCSGAYQLAVPKAGDRLDSSFFCRLFRSNNAQ